ncbi:MAG: hypothetical protein HKN25_01000 [Pyrinomonadaceae bacterium]|nr:hypothetical protein [Pyrinomonadaceae bacterium]
MLGPPNIYGRITGLFWTLRSGDRAVMDKRTPQVFDKLPRQTHLNSNKERKNHQSRTTIPVHEAYRRLVDQDKVRWRKRAQFVVFAAMMRRKELTPFVFKRCVK